MKGYIKEHKAMRVLLYIVIIILAITIIALIFMRAYPGFGGRPTSKDLEDYAKRADGCFDGKHFNYPKEWELEGITADNRVSKKGTSPKDELPVKVPDLTMAKDDDVKITWFGHSSLLIQMHGKNILIDPVFSKRSSPVQWVGPARFSEPGITIDDLPEIDAVLITHDHYDHLDMDAIKMLESKTAHYIVPLGIDKHIARWIKDDSKITNLAWWESYDFDGLKIFCTPANHKSGRALDNQQSTLFCSWVLKDEHHQILESGDTLGSICAF